MDRKRDSVSLVHYRDDPIVDAEQTMKLAAFLSRHGVAHTTQVLAGDSHRMTAEVLAAAREFVREACCGANAPTADGHSQARSPAISAP